MGGARKLHHIMLCVCTFTCFSVGAWLWVGLASDIKTQGAEGLRSKKTSMASPRETSRLVGGHGGFNWMPIPQETADCPGGLEYLLQLDRFIVSRYLESWGELLAGS